MRKKLRISTKLKKLSTFDFFHWFESFCFNLGTKLYNGTDPDYEYAYQYFVYGVLSQLMWMLSGLTISILLNCWIEYILLCIGFCICRAVSGGLHLKNHMSCYWTTTFIMSMSAFLSKLLTIHYLIMFFMSIGSVLYIVWQVPKKSENTFDYTLEEEKMFLKKYTRSVLFIYIINLALIYFVKNLFLDSLLLRQIITSLSFGVTLSVAMLSDKFEWILLSFWKLVDKKTYGKDI